VVDPPARSPPHYPSSLVFGIARDGRILYDTYLARQRDAFLTISGSRKTKNARLVGRSTRVVHRVARIAIVSRKARRRLEGMHPPDSEMTIDHDKNRSSERARANLFR